MNYKHIFAAAALAIAACGSLSAQSVDPSELRIYINPGHGSWTDNDRAMQTIGRAAFNASNTDTTGFFESNTNLWKCFGLFNKLREYGLTFDDSLNPYDGVDPFDTMGPGRDLSNNIVMSRTKNGPYPTVVMGTDDKYGAIYNRDLYEVACEIEYNDFDMFISVHSNANSEGDNVNFPLFLYRGTDDDVSVPTSDDIADACWPYSIGNEHMAWSKYDLTNKNIRGDCSFYGSGYSTNAMGYYGYLAVLKNGVPGFLVEGYFHTYQPARQRAMNPDVDKEEGYEYAHGIADYYGLTKESTGEIYGIVRDQHEKFYDDLYHPMATTPDAYKPLNGVEVTLKKDGEVVDTYTTDQEWNGAYVFSDLEPGDYTLEFAVEGYKTSDPVDVTVTAATTAYPNAYLESEDYIPPEVVYENYPDEINTPAINAANEYAFDQEYVDNEISELAGLTLRRSVLKGDNLYLLALDDNNDATILVYDTKSKEVVANVSTEGMTGSELNVSDIQVSADGVLVACPKTKVQYDSSYGNDSIRFYKWENDANGLPAGDPEKMFSAVHTAASGNYYNAWSGETFAYSGTIAEGQIFYSAQTQSSKQFRVAVVSVIDGGNAGVSFTKPTYNGTNLTVDMVGEDFRFIVSPLDDANYVVVGSGSTPALEYSVNASNDQAPNASVPEDILAAATPNVGFFKYAGHAYMAAPDIDESQSVGVKLIDVTDGFGSASVVTTTNTAIEAADLTNISAAGTTVVTIDAATEEVTDAYINLFLTRGATSVSKFTTLGADQPAFRAEYAYDLAGEAGEGSTYNITFKSTGDAPDANLILEDEEGNTVTIPIGAVTAGENTVGVDIDDLEEGSYTWKVEIISDPIPTANKVYSALTYARGMAIDRNPESDYFGYAYVTDPYTDGGKGVYMFTPDLQQVNEDPYLVGQWGAKSTGSPYRVAINPNNNNVVVVDWSDDHAGLWAIDPADMTTMTQMFAGDLASTGAYTYDGKIIGGGGTGVDFYGSGEDTKLYMFCEDYPTGNNGNEVVGYDLGEAETITTVPTVISSSSLWGSTDVNVVANEKGIWCAQNRTAGNNTSGTPAFALFDANGNTLFNSSALTDLDGSGRGGLALSDDYSKLAIVDASSHIVIYDVEWNGSTPSFTKAYAFTFNTSTDTDADKIYQMQFDQAGNLYASNRYGLMVFGLPNDNPVAVTPAKAEYVIDTTGVKEILADDDSAQLKVYPNPATGSVNIEAGAEIGSISLYNLAGAMLKADALINGSSATLDVDGLASGIYLLNVDGKTVKLIKK